MKNELLYYVKNRTPRTYVCHPFGSHAAPPSLPACLPTYCLPDYLLACGSIQCTLQVLLLLLFNITSHKATSQNIFVAKPSYALL